LKSFVRKIKEYFRRRKERSRTTALLNYELRSLRYQRIAAYALVLIAIIPALQLYRVFGYLLTELFTFVEGLYGFAASIF
jgi:hypothetical protein